MSIESSLRLTSSPLSETFTHSPAFPSRTAGVAVPICDCSRSRALEVLDSHTGSDSTASGGAHCQRPETRSGRVGGTAPRPGGHFRTRLACPRFGWGRESRLKVIRDAMPCKALTQLGAARHSPSNSVEVVRSSSTFEEGSTLLHAQSEDPAKKTNMEEIGRGSERSR